MNLKDIFKIILVLQLLAFTLAIFGHPDDEVFSLPNQPSRDQLMIEGAIERGMDGEAVAELLRTRKPVVKTTTTPEGFTKTTTYKIEPDGSISSHWFTKSFSSWQDETPSPPAFNAGHQPIGIPSWSSGSRISEPEISIYSPTRTSTNTRTYIGPNGEKHVIQQTFSSKSYSSNSNIGSQGDFNPPNFNYPNNPGFIAPSYDHFSQSNIGSQENSNMPKYNYRSNTDKADTTTRKPLSNSKNFRKPQNKENPKRAAASSTAKTITYGTSTPKPLTSTPKIMNIDDLPVKRDIHNETYVGPKKPTLSGQRFVPIGQEEPHKSLVPSASEPALRSNIEAYLAKLGVTKFDIVDRSGSYSKTIIDKNGDVLTVTLVLSSPQGVKAGEKRIK